MKKISLIVIILAVIILILAATSFYILVKQGRIILPTKTLKCSSLLIKAKAYFGYSYPYGASETVMDDCKMYLNKKCVKEDDCGSFVCYQNKCLIKPCNSDDQCPAGMCGFYSTPVPRFCTLYSII
jgi:hypothetical protein